MPHGHVDRDVLTAGNIPPGHHLLLGISERGMVQFLERIGFPGSYTRDEREEFPGLGWVTRQYGPGLTGYDLCEAVRAWLRAEDKEQQSVCEVLRSEGSPHIAQANVFYSHVQRFSIGATIYCMGRACRDHAHALRRAGRGSPKQTGLVKTEGLFFWLDYFCLRQCQSDFNIPNVLSVVKQIGCTLAEIDAHMDYLSRTWCILELISTIMGDAMLLVAVRLEPHELTRKLHATRVDVASATTRNPRDKHAIDKLIADSVGFDTVNELTHAALVDASAKMSAIPLRLQCETCCERALVCLGLRCMLDKLEARVGARLRADPAVNWRFTDGGSRA